MSTFTPAELDRGRAAIHTVTRHYSQTGELPPNWRELAQLPVEIADPRTGAVRIVIFGEMTDQDMSDWSTSEEAAARDKYIAELDQISIIENRISALKKENEIMTTTEKKTPAAGQGNEGNEQFSNNTLATVYIHRRGQDTRDHFGTWGGVKIPKEDFIPVLVPVHVAQEMAAYGPQLVTINEGCVKAQSTAVRAAQEQDRRVRLNNERAVIVKGAEADITYSVELLDALGTDEWTEQLEHDAIEFLEEILDRPVDEVTAGLLTECRRVRRQQRDARLAELEQEAGQ